MKRSISLLLFFLLTGQIIGQKKARDFTVTTTDRQQITLYKDFLNKGKVVLLKIFFVDCPPCNDIAPQVSTLYKKYGSGREKVEFIELSNKAWDSDAAVIGYKIKHDLPCPSASNDGGSVQAAALYSDNTYGPFFGTPSFVVIKPNGDVIFDPRGTNKNETINKLDLAITDALKVIPGPVDTMKQDTTKPTDPRDTIKPNPTDTIKPTPTDTIKPSPIKVDTIRISGKLIFNNLNPGLPLASTNITLRWNKKEYKSTTDSQGSFTFLILDSLNSNGSPGNFIIDYNPAYNFGISALDMLTIQKHILGISTLSNFKERLAADVNSDNDISVIDLLEMRKVILGVTDKFANNTPSVHFIFQNANNLIKSISNPLSYDELKSLNKFPITVEVIKSGKIN